MSYEIDLIREAVAEYFASPLCEHYSVPGMCFYCPDRSLLEIADFVVDRLHEKGYRITSEGDEGSFM